MEIAWVEKFVYSGIYTRVQEEASPPGDVVNHVVYTVSVNFPPFPRKHN